MVTQEQKDAVAAYKFASEQAAAAQNVMEAEGVRALNSRFERGADGRVRFVSGDFWQLIPAAELV